MKKLVRTVVVLAVVCAVFLAAFLLLLREPQEVVSDGAVFTDVQPVDIQSVSVTNASGEYRYYYEDDGYVLDDIPPEICDLDAFIEFMTNCGQLRADQRVAREDALPAEYGLDEPAATAVIEMFDGSALTLHVGNQETVSQNYYVSADGFDGIYVMSKELASQFLVSKKLVISYYATPELAVSSPLSAVRDVTFSGGALEAPVTIRTTSGGGEEVRLEALSFGTPTHIVKGAGVYQLDQAYGIEVLGSLFGIEATDIVGYNLTDEQIASLGFDAPYMTVEYDMVNSADGADAVHCVLKLVQIDENSFYSMLEGTGIVYQIGRPAFVDLQYDKLFLRWFLTPLIMDLSDVTIEGAQGSYRFEIDNGDLRNPVVTCNGQTVDTELFRAFFRLITSAAHDGNYLGALTPQGSPVLQIRYGYRDEAKQDDLMQLYTGDARRVNVFVNGSGEFAMKDTFVERVEQACQDLLAGNAIEENW